MKALEIKRVLDKLKHKLSALLADSFKSKSILQAVLVRMEDAVSTMYKLYERLEEFKQHVEFANYIGDLAHQEVYISTDKYKNEIIELKRSVQA
jgi:hypothetical protein